MTQTWRTLLRIVGVQCLIGIFGAAAALIFQDANAAMAFLLGACLMAFVTLVAMVFGLRPANSAADSLAKVLGSSVAKWLLVVLGMVLFLTRWQLAALPLCLGVIGAQLGYIASGLRDARTKY